MSGTLDRVNNHYHHLVFGKRSAVRQQRDGGWTAYGRHTERTDDGVEALDYREKAMIRSDDQFHIATVTESGWPYIQYRSGPKGFLQILDDHTLGFADFKGNSQYVTASNFDNAIAWPCFSSTIRTGSASSCSVVPVLSRPRTIPTSSSAYARSVRSRSRQSANAA